MKYLFFIFLIFHTSTSIACLNEEHVNKSGKSPIDFSLQFLFFTKAHNKGEIELAIKNLQSEKPEDEENAFEIQNDIAVNYIKLDRLAEAETILNTLLKKKPKNYSVIVNLGTLYELQGNNKKALEFIQKAIAINPESHDGSEWFHVRILEFKLKNIPESEIPNQNILKLNSLNSYIQNIASNVGYQLQERIPFTTAPNLMMAKVLQEFGDYLADSVSIKGAYLMYEVGMDYDRNNILSLSAKRDALKPYFKKYKEDVPITQNYYIDKFITAAESKTTEVATSILENGLNYFKEKEQKAQQEKTRKKFITFGSVGLAAFLFILLFLRNKKKSSL